MTLGEMHNIRNQLLDELDQSITIKKKRGLDLANAEANYRMLRTSKMAEVMIDGYKFDNGRTKPIAATAAKDFVVGLKEIAKLRQARDAAKVLMETVQEHIYAIKARLRVIEQDITNELTKLGR